MEGATRGLLAGGSGDAETENVEELLGARTGTCQ